VKSSVKENQSGGKEYTVERREDAVSAISGGRGERRSERVGTLFREAEGTIKGVKQESGK